MRDSTSRSIYVVPAGWNAKVLGTYECQGTIYHEIEMVPNRWDWRYWLWRLRMRFAKWEEIEVKP